MWNHPSYHEGIQKGLSGVDSFYVGQCAETVAKIPSQSKKQLGRLSDSTGIYSSGRRVKGQWDSDSINFSYSTLQHHLTLEKVIYLPDNFLCLTHAVTTAEQRKNYLVVIHRIQGPNCSKSLPALHLAES